jgi:hypothetical protein
VLGAKLDEAVFPAEVTQQPGSGIVGGTIARGQFLAQQFESLDRRGEVSHDEGEPPTVPFHRGTSKASSFHLVAS